MIGARLGSYEITGPLGEGGMGVVYRATDSKLKREVAIKVFPEAFGAVLWTCLTGMALFAADSPSP